MNWEVPYFKSNWGDEEEQAVLEVMKSYQLVHGPKHDEFAHKFAQYIGVKHALPLNSCTSALELALKASDLKKGGKVICPAYTYPPTISAIINSGFSPVIVDVDRHYNMDPKFVQEVVNCYDDVVAVMPVYFGGEPIRYDNHIFEWKKCRDRGIKIIADCAQAAGAEIDGQKVGSIEEVGCFSFFPTKNMSCGEGGMLTTNDDDIYEKALLLSSHGVKKVGLKKECVIPAHNYRMTDILATIGIVQLSKLDKMNKERTEIACKYNEFLSNVEGLNIVSFPDDADSPFPFVADDFPSSSFQMFMIEVDAYIRDSLVEHLRGVGIEAMIHYSPIIPEMDVFKPYLFGKCEKAIEHSKRCLSLPIYPFMADEDIEYVCEEIESIMMSESVI